MLEGIGDMCLAIQTLCLGSKFRKYRRFESEEITFDKGAMKQDVEELDLGVAIVMVFGFVGEIVGVDVDDDFACRGDLFVNKYDTTDNNHAHPYSKYGSNRSAVCGEYIYHVRTGLSQKFVVVVRKYQSRLVRAGFLAVHPGVRNNDDDIAYLHQSCCGAVEAYCSRATFSRDDIGLQASSVVVVDDLHLLIR